MTPDSEQQAGAAVSLRVAVVGSGPAGFYATEALLKQSGVVVDMFERLPAPFGLVRFGVAPDHQRIKKAAAAFERTASHAAFRFFGNVEIGRDVTIDELRSHYDQVLIAIGAAADRRLNVPGEDLEGSHAATNFVGWYNGHPDYTHHRFDLSHERAVVIGVGNVALDVTRILVRSPDELATTDIAGYALDALRQSRVREVVVIGRRSPAQAAFDAGEIEDIAALSGVEVRVNPADLEIAAETAGTLTQAARHNLAVLRRLADAPRATNPERIVSLRFLFSPRELIGRGGHVAGLRVERNRLEVGADGLPHAVGTGQHDVIDTGFVLRSIGYRGVGLRGLPFDERSGTIPNVAGRVAESPDGPLIPGLYVTGWIKRGPTGLIGANKPDAQETVRAMLDDAARPSAGQPAPGGVERLLAERGVRVVSYPEWRHLDQEEVRNGQRLGKVREKFWSTVAMLEALTRR